MCTTISPTEAGLIFGVGGLLAALPVVAGVLAAWRPTRGRLLAALGLALAPGALALALQGGGFLRVLGGVGLLAALLWGLALARPAKPLRWAALAASALPLLVIAYLGASFALAPPKC